MKAPLIATAALGLWAQGTTAAISLTVNDDNSVKQAASTLAYGLMRYYTGNNTGDVPGNLPSPYYWWEAGALFGTMVDYWYLTGDSTYNDPTMQALIHQAGDPGNFLPKNQSLSEGNDDQGFWALAAMTAAENVFPNPPSDKPQWLALAQSVFNQYVSRWETKACGGGLVWQIFSWNKGNDYKNSVANGCFFNLAARLSRYTGNSTYGDWAKKIYQWEEQVGLITNTSQVFDGIGFDVNTYQCGKVNNNQWSYNTALFMHGAAAMYNITKDDFWKSRLDGLLKDATTIFMKDGVPYEQYCELAGFCDLNQVSFKGYLLRWLAGTTKMAPYTADGIMKVIQSAAGAATSTCIGPVGPNFRGIDGTACGFGWTEKGKFDGKCEAPATEASGGTSKGDPGAGQGSSNTQSELDAKTKPTPGGRFGAAVLTILLVGCVIGGSVSLVL
ncbi:Mannan endo-1,6-alpha-mannosidase DCW1 [Cladobotryum mycophilum]|uniref:Mannan endo-1,6-alpha-mannosidase n=1 Tax=Cladobotryum mycophilum TaxID=491253 RepID=A0ABR0SNV1_9HYPO